MLDLFREAAHLYTCRERQLPSALMWLYFFIHLDPGRILTATLDFL